MSSSASTAAYAATAYTAYAPVFDMKPQQAAGALYVIILTAVVLAITVWERVKDCMRTSAKSKHLQAADRGMPATASTPASHSSIGLFFHRIGIAQQTPPLHSLLGTSLGTGEILLLAALLLLNFLLVLLPLPWPEDPTLILDLDEISKRAAWIACGNAFWILISKSSRAERDLTSLFCLPNANSLPFPCLRFLAATRNSLITLLTGIPFERTLVFHRWFGYLLFAEFTVHAALIFIYYAQYNQLTLQMKDMNNIFATVSWAALVVLTLLSLPIVRRSAFQVFYYTHFLFVVFIIFGALHRVAFAWFAAMGCVLYAFDRILRFIRSRAKVEVLDVRPLHSASGGCTKVVVKLGSGEPKEWEAGQYAFISAPRIGNLLDYYPMSASSAPDIVSTSKHASLVPFNPTAPYTQPNGKVPEGTVVTFHIKAAGGFTAKLYSAASDLDGSHAAVNSETLEDGMASALRKLTDLSVDGFHGNAKLDFTSYPTVVLIGGGIGVTPMLSIARDLGNRMALPLSQQPGAPTLAFETRTVYLLWYARTADEYSSLRDECRGLWSLARGLKDRGLRLVLRVFLTRSEPSSDADAIERANIFSARPTPTELLEDVKKRHPVGDAAVAVCGPAKLVKDVRNSCAEVSDKDGVMGVHWESFEL